ncbi:Glycerophosphocholine phosphodiesterase, partial [Xylographa soralifera]|nr:Glycerophosphocholine phosphodiesterase [Xylographa soralifera]
QNARAIYTRYYLDSAPQATNLAKTDLKELEDLLQIAVELCNELRKLQWYGKVNHDGFLGIKHKVDEFKSGNHLAQSSENELTLSDFQFASQTKCIEMLKQLNRLISDVNKAHFISKSSSTHTSLIINGLWSCFRSPVVSPDTVYFTVLEDDATALNHLIRKQMSFDRGLSFSHKAVLLALLEYAISCRSLQCIDTLLLQLGSLQEKTAVDGSNWLHYLVIQLGRKAQKLSNARNDGKESFTLLSYVLQRLRPSQRRMLQERDSLKRLPLHYAAKYGSVEACQNILMHMQAWKQLYPTRATNAILLEDIEELTPLHLGVSGGYVDVVRTLLDFHDIKNGTDRICGIQSFSIPGSILATAIRLISVEIVQLLVVSTININHQDNHGQTALYVAAQFGHEDCIKCLTEALRHYNASIDVPEMTYGWTPLVIASVEGHLETVKLLLRAGANHRTCDFRGWTATANAAFRGCMELVKTLNIYDSRKSASVPSSILFPTTVETPGVRSIYRARRGGGGNFSSASSPAVTAGCCLSNEKNQIIVNLGSMNTKNEVTAVELSSLSTLAPWPETKYSIEIRSIGGSGTSGIVPLPVLEDRTNKPWLFSTKVLSEFKLVFNIFCTAGSTMQVGTHIGSVSPSFKISNNAWDRSARA